MDPKKIHSAEDDENYLDRLPDELLLMIFSKVRDAGTLIRVLSLSRRLRSLIPLTDSISLSPQLFLPPSQRKTRPSFSKNPLAFLLERIFRNPIRRLISPKSRPDSRSLYYEEDIFSNIGERLKLFREARDVRVILPCDVGMADWKGTLLKWKASYGSEIKSCVILGASEVHAIGDSFWKKAASNEESAMLLANDELKLRVVWIISCLIAASYRHYMIKKMIASNPTLRRVVVSDERKQGKVVMGEEEVSEVRKESDRSEEDNYDDRTERSKVPDLRMKLWYVPHLELAKCGRSLKGATLVVITPVVNGDGDGGRNGGGKDEECENEILESGFEEDEEEEEGGDEDAVFAEAARELRKRKKLYLMEMNSF